MTGPTKTPTDREIHGSDTGPSRRRGRVLPLIAALVVLVLGCGISTFAASAAAANRHSASKKSFAVAAERVASNLRASLLEENDLVVSTSTYVAQSPNLTDKEFDQWVSGIRALADHPEVATFAYVAYVTSARLPAFAAEVKADPPIPFSGPFVVTPPGPRPYYCLTAAYAAVPRPPLNFSAGYDGCAGQSGAISSRDSGTIVNALAKLNGTTVFVVSAPLYAGGGIPSTLAARKATFLGFLAVTVVPQVVLGQALAGDSSMAVEVTGDELGGHATFGVGHLSSGDARYTLNIGTDTVVTVYGPIASASIWSDKTAIGLFALGLALTLAVGGLLWVLLASRSKALNLVDKRTGQLRHQALHDGLTGLANRVLVNDRAEQLLLRSRRNGTEPAALYLDLDGFKTVNDTLGHIVGDELLKAVADRLRSSLREVDTIGRLGGDEFVVLLETADLAGGVELVAERIVSVLSIPFSLAVTPAPVSISVSVGLATGDRSTADDLMRDADIALYEAKKGGKNCFRPYHTDLYDRLLRRHRIELDLPLALDRDQFELLYQPIYDLESLTVIGGEALLRWNHPELGQIRPDEFLPVLEGTGLITTVGRYVLREACANGAAWQQSHPGLKLAVNLSARQLDDRAIVDLVREALEQSGMEPATLTLEVTETSLLLDTETTIERLSQLKALGVTIAVDDFGTGYSTLAYIQRYPIDCLKIDRAFTQNVSASPGGEVLVHNLIQLAKSLGLRTIAEGVESTAQVDHMRKEQVDEAQGFLFARPLSSRAFSEQLLQLDPVR